jgi:amidase
MARGPCELPARVLASRLRRGALTATEVLEAHLARIERHDPALGAVVALDAAQARKRARAADAAFRRGKLWGPLHGVPMTLKDGHDVAGLRTTLGTRELDRVADRDGTVAARLRAAGAIIIGHSNVASWLADPLQTANPVFGRTSNPWDPARTPGGSSGGAAAALAAGLTPLEVCSDLAGSIRLPAHFCGVYGLKTTELRVPLTGFFHVPGAPRSVRIMSSLGPMARDLGDLELALGLIAGPDGQEVDVPPVPLGRRRPRSLRGLRLAVAPTVPGATVARSVRAQVERVAAAASRKGARVLERLPAVDWEALSALFAELVGVITSVFAPHAEPRTLAWYLEALDRRDRLAAAWEAFFAGAGGDDGVDGLLCPPAATPAFPHVETGAPVEVDGKPVSYWEIGRLPTFANLTGLPALVAPAGRDEAGLPIGVQLIGPRWSELRLLEIAGALEEAGILPGFQAPPGY